MNVGIYTLEYLLCTSNNKHFPSRWLLGLISNPVRLFAFQEVTLFEEERLEAVAEFPLDILGVTDKLLGAQTHEFKFPLSAPNKTPIAQRQPHLSSGKTLRHYAAPLREEG